LANSSIRRVRSTECIWKTRLTRSAPSRSTPVRVIYAMTFPFRSD
jgi:hypothetical protein